MPQNFFQYLSALTVGTAWLWLAGSPFLLALSTARIIPFLSKSLIYLRCMFYSLPIMSQPFLWGPGQRRAGEALAWLGELG